MSAKNFIVRAGADFSELEKKLQGLQKTMAKTGKGLSSAGKTLSTYVTAPIMGAAAASFKLASDMEESLNKVKVAFGNNSGEVEKWASTSLKSFGVAKGTALDMAALFGDMGTSMGLSTGEAAKMSTSLAGLAGDLSSFKNIGVDQATTALNGIFTGETESLKTLGIVMTQANLENFALANGYGKTIKQMTEAEKVQLRYAYVMEKTKNAQGDFARTSDGAANQMRIFTESLKETGASFGAILLPIITPMIQKINEWVKKFGALDEKTKKLIITVALFAAAAGPILSILGGTITNVSKVIGVVGKFSKAVSGGSTVVKAFGALLGPGGVVLIAVAAFAAGAYLVYKNWGKIKDFFSGLKTSILGFFRDIKSAWDNWNPKEKVFNALTTAGEDGTQLTYKYDPSVVNSGDFKKMAKGGIVTKPTYALVGEAGPEAVIPLDKMQGNSSVVINVTGNTIASDYDVEKIGTKLAGIISRENRRIANRASLIPIG